MAIKPESLVRQVVICESVNDKKDAMEQTKALFRQCGGHKVVWHHNDILVNDCLVFHFFTYDEVANGFALGLGHAYFYKEDFLTMLRRYVEKQIKEAKDDINS